MIGDGMADDPVAVLGGKTPLQYANTPAMDALASAGIIGSVRTIPEGMPAGSDTAALSIFGYDPGACYTGRAPLEAAASGIRMSPGDVAYRCNMVAIKDGDMPYDEKRLLSHSAGSIEGDQSIELITSLFGTPAFREKAEKAGVTVYPSPSFRHIAVQKSVDITGLKLIPPHDHLGEKVGRILPEGCENASVLDELMRLAHVNLNDHPLNMKRREMGKLPANAIWFWAEGVSVGLPGFTVKYGRTGGVISAVPLCQGIAVLAGLDKIYVEGATGELHTNYEGKADAVLEALGTYDFAAVHIEAPDECTHDGDLKGKIQAIEWIDARVVATLVRRLSDAGTDYRMLVISDHKTLLSTRAHDGDPVPFIIYDSRYDRKTGRSYCEAEAAHGQFIGDGTNLMDMLFETDT